MTEAIRFLTSLAQALAKMSLYADGHPTRAKAADASLAAPRPVRKGGAPPRVAVLGPATGMGRSFLDSFLAALVDPAPERTTALSATLLELATHGLLAEPAGRLLDLSPAGERAWPAALARLRRLGNGSGRAYAAGIAAACLLGGAAGERAVPDRG